MLNKCYSYLLCFVFITVNFASYAAVPADVEVIYETEHHKRIKINNKDYNQIFEKDVMSVSQQFSQQSSSASAKAATVATPVKTNESVVVNNLKGVLEAGFPQWLEHDILEDAGFSDWSQVSAEQMIAPIDRLVIDIDAMNQVSQYDGANMQSMATRHNLRLNGALGVSPQGWFCSKKWKDKEKSFNKSFDKQQEKLASYNKDGIEAALNGTYEGKGTFKAGIYYRIKTRCGIPYKAEFVRAAIDVDADLKGKIGLDGHAKYKYEKNNLIDKINLWYFNEEWWVYIFQLELELQLQMDIGVKFKVEAATAFNTAHNVTGSAKVSWTCTKASCDKTRNEVDFDLTLMDQPNYSAQIRVELTPYVDTNFTAYLDMYWGAIELANAKVGIVAALPVTLFGYYGNMCSDANDDGQNEHVDALLVDATAQIYGYMKVKVGGKKWLTDLKIKVAGWKLYDKQFTLYTEQDLTATVYSKNLYYKDLLSGGSAVMEPAITLPDIVKTDGAILVASRSCHPFTDSLTYEIDWGDGSPNYVGAGGRINHNWLQNGNTLVRTRLLSDAAGRTFVERWTEKRVNVSPDGVTPSYPWLVPVLSLLLH